MGDLLKAVSGGGSALQSKPLDWVASGRTDVLRRGGIPKPAATLVLILAVLAVLEWLLPLGTAVKLGADEGLELSKPTLCLNGYHLYTEIWNDQPPLYTFLVTGILKHIGYSVLGPRVLTACFGALLLGSFFLLVHRASGLRPAALATGMLMASPGFLELSSSCMQEIPALSVVVACLSVLLLRPFGGEPSLRTKAEAKSEAAVSPPETP